jgi:general secretion pathway protein D
VRSPTEFSPFAKRAPAGLSAAGLWLVLALSVLSLLMAAPRAAWSQPRPEPQPANLTSVIPATDAAPGESKVTLNFIPQAPKFSVIHNDSDSPSIAFALSSRAQGVSFHSDGKGLLRSIEFEQADTVMVLHLTVSGPAHLTVTAAGDKGIVLTLAPPSRTAAGGVAGPVSLVGGLPPAMSRPASEDEFEVIPLKYADVSEVVGLLTDGLSVKSNDSFNPREPAFGSAGMAGAGGYVAPPQSPGDATDQPMAQTVDDTIGVDRRLNAIILHGSHARIERLKAKIAKIDVPVVSVVLETVFVELTETGAKNVGLDFNNANNQIAVATFQSGQYNTAFQTHGGVSSVSLQAAIYAQVQKGRGRIISKPRIAAQSGGSAKIITGDALPILTSIALSGVNAVSQQVQYVNVGVTLQIAPRITDDGFVTSHVFCEVSSVTGVSQGYPTISQREASTSATVKDGESFVIGGLSQDSDIATDSKAPIAGDIPLLGELFRVKKDTRSKTDLYIVVTPHIVRGADPAAALLIKTGD